jgi:RNA polymerase primary sigma factor
MDIVQEGVLGLRKAALAYRAEEALERGEKEPYKFSTYASWWIRQSITRAVEDTARAIRLPVHVQAQIRKLKAASAKLQANMVEPSLEELAKATGFSEQEVGRLLQSSIMPASLYQPTGNEEEDGGTLLDTIPDTSGYSNVEEAATRNLSKRILMAALRQILDPKQFKVVAERFGLYDGRQRSREEIGQELGVTHERIRQIEVKALGKLGSSAYFCAQFKGMVA